MPSLNIQTEEFFADTTKIFQFNSLIVARIESDSGYEKNFHSKLEQSTDSGAFP